MAIAKTYFAFEKIMGITKKLPAYYSNLHDKNAFMRINHITIDGVSDLTNAYFNENPINYHNKELGWELVELIASGNCQNCIPNYTDCNFFNPFYLDCGLDFNSCSGISHINLTTGTKSGSYYGYTLSNLGVEPFLSSVGGFYVLIDYCKSFSMEVEFLFEGIGSFLYNFEYNYIQSSYSATLFDGKTSFDLLALSEAFLSGTDDRSLINLDDVRSDCSFPVMFSNTGYLTKFLGLPIDITPPIEDIRKSNDCCYNYLALAHETENDRYFNDFNSFFYERKETSETCLFKLYDVANDVYYDLTDDSFGEFHDFGTIDNENLQVITIEWQSVLLQLGEGVYEVFRETQILGITTEIKVFNTELRQFTYSLANKTTRLDIEMSGYKLDTVYFGDFVFKDSLRLLSFFGKKQTSIEEERIIYTNYNEEQVTSQGIRTYNYFTIPIDECYTEKILDFFVFANVISANDYNSLNHSYNYKNKPVIVDAVNDTVYYNNSRKARVSIDFKDFSKNNRKENF